MRIEEIEAFRLKLPLKRPYHLAIAEVTHFDTIVILIHSDGQTGVGETTPLEGYSHERLEDVWNLIKQLGSKAAGKSVQEATGIVAPYSSSFPFAATGMMTALEELEGLEILRPPAGRAEVEILGILNETTMEGIQKALPALLDAGYRTIKFKVGFNVLEDIKKVQFIQTLLKGRAQLRLDANQQYSFEDAIQFGQSVDPSGIELFEQPLNPDDWDGMARLSRGYPLPLMLDEAIYDMNDIEKAAQLKCAQFIKLKLMKCGGAQRCATMIRRVRELGMDIIIGNGVASDIGCYHEALIAHHLGLSRAGEMNGFLKPKDTLVEPRMDIQEGKIILGPGSSPRILRKKLEAVAVERAAWRV